ncbi:MAG TPA: hypothetical protein VFT78_03520 [Hanamia sp.]|nr:hypothetical protein [Hanamia sp.]
MNLSEFVLLSEGEKKWQLMNNGVALAKRTYEHLIIFLFQFEDYYVEAYCNVEDKTIREFRMLPGIDAISHYLEAIPIDGLLN